MVTDNGDADDDTLITLLRSNDFVGTEILKRLSLKSICTLKCVSKKWYSLISLIADNDTVNQALYFAINIKRYSRPDIYSSFLNLLNYYRMGKMTRFEFDRDVCDLLHDDRYLLDQFRKVLKRNSDDPSLVLGVGVCRDQRKRKSNSNFACGVDEGDDRSIKGTIGFKRGMIVFEKVKEALRDSNEFLWFLKLIHCFNKERINKIELRNQVGELLVKYPKLLEELFAYLDGCGSMDLSLDCDEKLVLKSTVLEGRNRKEKKQKCVMQEDMDLKKTRDDSFEWRHNVSYEELMFQCEDYRFELDLLIHSAKDAIQFAKKLLKSIKANESFNKSCPIRFLRIIENVYERWGLDVLDILQKDPVLALPVILPRLKQKKKEWKRARSDFDLFWSNVRAKNHL